MAIKLAALVLAASLVLATQVTADHNTKAAYKLPHHVAVWMLDVKLMAYSDADRYSSPGCDYMEIHVVTTSPDHEIMGFMMLATDGVGTRLVHVVAWDTNGEIIFSWVDQEDHDALVTCHNVKNQLEV